MHKKQTQHVHFKTLSAHGRIKIKHRLSVALAQQTWNKDD